MHEVLEKSATHKNTIVKTSGKSQETGFIVSGTLHLAFLVFLIFGMPDLFKPNPPEESVMVVEVLPISATSNVNVARPIPKEETQDKPDSAKPPAPKEEPKPEKQEVKPTPKDAENLPKDIKKPEKKPEPKEVDLKKLEEDLKKEKKKKEDELDADSLLKTLEKTAKKSDEKGKDKKIDNAQDNESKIKGRSNKTFDPNQKMSLSIRDAIRSQIQKCWSIPAGARDVQNMRVTLKIILDINGNVEKVDISKTNSSGGFYQSFADSAVRAVWKCNPLLNLPQDQYENWKEFELNFDPSDMIY